MVGGVAPFTFMTSALDEIPTHDLLALYGYDALRHSLLSLEEELALGKQIDDGLQASHKLDKGLFKGRKQKADLERTVRKGKIARDDLTSANYRLVVSAATSLHRHTMEVTLIDLIQEGNLGLLRAVEKYDYRRGYKFSTYATWWIRQSITRFVALNNRSIRLPVYVFEAINKARREMQRLEAEWGREPTRDEVRESLGWSERRFKKIMGEMTTIRSLDERIGDDPNTTLADFVPDTDNSTTETAEQSELTQTIRDLLNDEKSFTPREVQIIEMRYGFQGGEAMTLEQVGKRFGLTRERIRQIEIKVLQRLRHPSRLRRLRPFLTE